MTESIAFSTTKAPIPQWSWNTLAGLRPRRTQLRSPADPSRQPNAGLPRPTSWDINSCLRRCCSFMSASTCWKWNMGRIVDTITLSQTSHRWREGYMEKVLLSSTPRAVILAVKPWLTADCHDVSRRHLQHCHGVLSRKRIGEPGSHSWIHKKIG